jgi:hypothetical protein
MYPRLGENMGDLTMTDSESWKERRNNVARYRAMEQETTDPLAAPLLRDIVLDLEAELEGSRNDPSSSWKRGGNMSNLLFTLGVGASFFLAMYQWATMIAETIRWLAPGLSSGSAHSKIRLCAPKALPHFGGGSFLCDPLSQALGRCDFAATRKSPPAPMLLSWRNCISFGGNPAFAAVHLPPEHQHACQHDERSDGCKRLAGIVSGVHETNPDGHRNRAHNPNRDLRKGRSAPVQWRVKTIVESEQEQRHKAQEVEMSMRGHRRVVLWYAHLNAPDHTNHEQHNSSLEA